MEKINFNRHIIQRIGFLIGLATLFLGISACSVVKVVPYTPTPNSAAMPQSPTNQTATTEGPPKRIVAQAIDLDAPIVEMGWRVVEQWGQPVSQWDMPDSGAAWHLNSSLPGRGSNIVISGHNESTGDHVFAELEELQIGDEITLWNDNQESFVYQLVEKNIIRTLAASQEAQNYLQTATEPTATERLTLITCWPRWTNTHRLIVIAEPISVISSQ